MSISPLYWPREPTEMPCDPLQCMFCTRMSVLFGLNETQSAHIISTSSTMELRCIPSPLFTTEFWMTIFDERYVSLSTSISQLHSQ